MPQQPLSGQHFLVTRPAGQGAQLLAGIEALGGVATHIPFLKITVRTDQSALAHIAQSLPTYDACIFISANAAQVAWPTLAATGWPTALVAVAIGPGTARVLRDLGASQVIFPTSQFDSEGLLAEAAFSEYACRGRRIALIRGEGGRDFFANTLRQRGAQVDEAAVYTRSLCGEAVPSLRAWLETIPKTCAVNLLISSSESLQRLMTAIDQLDAMLAHRLRNLPVLVPHVRIGECAQRLGFAQVMLTPGGDAGILDFLRSYNRPRTVST